MNCQIENFISTGSAYCDCEKQVTDNSDINQNNTAQKNIFKEKGTDHIFTLNNKLQLTAQNLKSRLTFSQNNISQIPSGFHSIIFQPPKA